MKCELSTAVEADGRVIKKISQDLLTEQTTGLFKHQNNSLFVIEQPTSSEVAGNQSHFLTAAVTPIPQDSRYDKSP
jgi:hypothetical protein